MVRAMDKGRKAKGNSETAEPGIRTIAKQNISAGGVTPPADGILRDKNGKPITVGALIHDASNDGEVGRVKALDVEHDTIGFLSLASGRDVFKPMMTGTSSEYVTVLEEAPTADQPKRKFRIGDLVETPSWVGRVSHINNEKLLVDAIYEDGYGAVRKPIYADADECRLLEAFEDGLQTLLYANTLNIGNRR